MPADTQLERTDLHAAYGNYFFSFNRPIIKPLGESVCNTELFRKLAAKMGYVTPDDNAFTQTDEEMIRELIDPANPLMEGITFEQFEQNGWVKASVDSERRNYLKNGWPTPSKKIEILCEALTKEYPDVDPLPAYVPEISGQEDPLRSKYPLQVISFFLIFSDILQPRAPLIGYRFFGLRETRARSPPPRLCRPRSDPEAPGIRSDARIRSSRPPRLP